jgi:protein SCO1/2
MAQSIPAPKLVLYAINFYIRNMNDQRIKRIFIGASVFLFLMIVVAVTMYSRQISNDSIPVFGNVGDFSFTERNGEAIGSNDLAGRISVVNFFFTTCEGPCPKMNGQVAFFYRKFKDNAKVQFVSISVDPDRDSLQALQAYAQKFNVKDRRWLFLRAPIEEVKELSEKTFLLAGADSPGLHSTKLILIDGQKRVRGYYSSEEDGSLRRLEEHILTLLKE